MGAVCKASLSLLVTITTLASVHGITIDQAQNLTAQDICSGFIWFGDSFVDTGNNNFKIGSISKANFSPYGMNFYNEKPTGRFSDGRLIPDLIADIFNMSNIVPPYLNPSFESQLIKYTKYVVSLASAGSGYDPLTAIMTTAYTFRQEQVLFARYKDQLVRLFGTETAEEIVNKSVCMVVIGTNDWIINWRPNSTSLSPRRLQYTEEQYETFLINKMAADITIMNDLGCNRVGVLGVPAIGCMPYVKTTAGNGSFECVDDFNKAAISINMKIQPMLVSLQQELNIKTTYVDYYSVLADAIYNGTKYGFNVTSKGCCGTGLFEFGLTCHSPISTCPDASKYVFWDAVHPTQRFYEILANVTVESFDYEFFF